MFTPGIVTSSTDGYVKFVDIVLADADQWPNTGTGKRPPRQILCKTAGTLKVTGWDGGDPQSIPLVAGQFLNVQPSRCWLTGTTGTYAACY